MKIMAIAGIAIVAAMISVMLKKYNPEYSIVLSIGAGLVIVFMIFTELSPAINKMSTLISMSGISDENIRALFKALGVCLLVQFTSDSCNDAGESALAFKIELAGKVMILVLSLPLFEQIIKIVSGLLGA